MAGEAQATHTDAVVAYLTRLMGQAPTVDEALGVRSVHRAALASWARKQNVPVRLAVLTSGAPFSIRELLSDGESQPVAASAKPLPAPQAAAGAFFGVGIDIEEVSSLPQTFDYREHPFFQDNFTPAEVAYCIRQSDIRASFCGLWAAKEALFKAGLVTGPLGNFKSIEIQRDAVGRAIFPGCQISISHTPSTAVAICLVTSATSPAPRTAAEAETSTAAPNGSHQPERGGKRWPWSRTARA